MPPERQPEKRREITFIGPSDPAQALVSEVIQETATDRGDLDIQIQPASSFKTAETRISGGKIPDAIIIQGKDLSQTLDFVEGMKTDPKTADSDIIVDGTDATPREHELYENAGATVIPLNIEQIDAATDQVLDILARDKEQNESV